jgi:ABC-2 type transport system permease protein/lipopolysaccharide transport system permease protein
MAGDDSPPNWKENAAGSGVRAPVWSEFWSARELVWFFAVRDAKVRYKQAVLGVAWVLLQPIATVAAVTVVFDHVADIGSQGLPYPLFALTGVISWTYFASATARASGVLVADSALITKVYFPRLAAPTGSLFPPLVDLAVSLVLVALLMLYYGTPPSLAVLALPAWLLLLVLTALGVSMWLSALNVRYRDVQTVIQPLLQLWLFLSPVFYPASSLSGWRELAFGLNPMTGVVGLGRWSLLGAPWPGWPLAVSVASATAVLAGGLWYFRRVERSFADVI